MTRFSPLPQPRKCTVPRCLVAVCCFLSILLGITQDVKGQSGLEGILIDTFYVADAADASTAQFPVPSGAVTYRIYVDMAPGWELQAIYGTQNTTTGDVDSFYFRSTMPFFNNEDRGEIFGYNINTSNLDENTVLLDSYVSTGRSSSTTEAVLKAEDTNGAVPAFPNIDGLLQNNDQAAGIPISTADGNVPTGPTTSTWALIGVNPTDLAVLGDVDLLGNEFVTIDGALFSNSSTQGFNGGNRVLVAQLTTAGEVSAKLNVQLRNISSGVIEQWVADEPETGQFTSPDLTIVPNRSPEVSITKPSSDTVTVFADETFQICIDALDTDGAIQKVDLFLDDVLLGSDNSAPFEFAVVALESGNLIARARDDRGGFGFDSIFLDTNPYKLTSVDQICNEDSYLIPIEVGGNGVVDVIGYDIEVEFDNTKLLPTGTLIRGGGLLDPALYESDLLVDFQNGQLNITLFLDAAAPPGTTFSGEGVLAFIEFNKLPDFDAIDTASVVLNLLQESFASGVITRDTFPESSAISSRNSDFVGALRYWSDNAAIGYDSLNPSANDPTFVVGSTDSCSVIGSDTLTPSVSGIFVHDLDNGVYLNISRDISNSDDVMSFINSFDAFLVRKVLLGDRDFVPSVFQMLAMDVNQDGVISAGDVSQINMRSVLMIGEYRQAWNYERDGSQAPGYGPSLDWVFVSDTEIQFDPSYSISTTYPDDDGLGYSRFRVPIPGTCVWTNVEEGACPGVTSSRINGLVLGDVNGNFTD